MELQSLLEELSAVYPIKTLEEMYELATSEPFSFWYILLTANRKEEMFHIRFEHRMVPREKEWVEPLRQSQLHSPVSVKAEKSAQLPTQT